jgi:hypothetical protein
MTEPTRAIKPDDETAGIPATPPALPGTAAPETIGIPPDIAEELDEDEMELRALRRDLPGVKGSSAAGVVSISVGKAPDKNEFFRTHARFRPVVPIVNIEQRMEKHYFAVAPGMPEALKGIGISVNDYVLYWTVTARGASRIVPIRQAMGTASKTNTTAPRKLG